MSHPEPPDAVAFTQLEQMVRALGEELGRFRKRALHAEARVKELEEAGTPSDLFSNDRRVSLESENSDLRARLEHASTRTRAMLDRVRFLRQQAEAERDA